MHKPLTSNPRNNTGTSGSRRPLNHGSPVNHRLILDDKLHDNIAHFIKCLIESTVVAFEWVTKIFGSIVHCLARIWNHSNISRKWKTAIVSITCIVGILVLPYVLPIMFFGMFMVILIRSLFMYDRRY
jgi:hypothetical protein